MFIWICVRACARTYICACAGVCVSTFCTCMCVGVCVYIMMRVCCLLDSLLLWYVSTKKNKKKVKYT